MTTAELLMPVGWLGAGLTFLLLVLLWFRPKATAKTAMEKRWILVDGSNVLHWQDNSPSLQPLLQLITALDKRGFAPGFVFDANAGYTLKGRYLNERAFGKLLGLPTDRVFIVPIGQPADPYILSMARELQVSIVTNDLFRDWAQDNPEINEPGFLISGEVQGNSVKLRKLDLARPGTH